MIELKIFKQKKYFVSLIVFAICLTLQYSLLDVNLLLTFISSFNFTLIYFNISSMPKEPLKNKISDNKERVKVATFLAFILLMINSAPLIGMAALESINIDEKIAIDFLILSVGYAALVMGMRYFAMFQIED